MLCMVQPYNYFQKFEIINQSNMLLFALEQRDNLRLFVRYIK